MKLNFKCVLLFFLLLIVIFNFGCKRIKQGEESCDIDKLINDYDGINIYTLDLRKIIECDIYVVPKLSTYADDPSRNKRYAAIMGLSAIAKEYDMKETAVSVLKQKLKDQDISIKIIASSLLLSFGEKDGFDILIDNIDSEEMLRPSEPPMPISQKCLDTLRIYTGKDFSEKSEWSLWYKDNKEKLKWNAQDEKFE